jgi:hypothetical protein
LAVTGELKGRTLTLRGPAVAFGLAIGAKIYSATGFTLAGPLEADELTAAI